MAQSDTGPQETIHRPVAGALLFSTIAPMPVKGVAASLDRMYDVSTAVWNSSSSPGTVLLALNFPDALLSNTFVSERLDSYAHLRAGVRCELRVNGNKFIYGLLMAIWLPCTSRDQRAFGYSLIGLTSFPHLLISANSAMTYAIDAPYALPQPFVDLTTYRSGSFGTLLLVVLTPLTSSTSSSGFNLPIQVTAKFIDTVVSTPTQHYTLSGGTPTTSVALLGVGSGFFEARS